MFRFTSISLLIVARSAGLFAQDPLSYAIATPRPISPAAGSTNPSALATQSLNPYLGSVATGKLVDGEIQLTLEDPIQRGLNFNLGLIESQQTFAGVKAERARAFAALLPQITARAQQNFEQISVAEIGLKLPPQVPPSAGSATRRPASVCNTRCWTHRCGLSIELIRQRKRRPH